MRTVSEILEAYAFWDDMARAKQREQQRLRDRKTSINIVYSDAHGGAPETMEDYVVKLEELDMDLEELREERFKAYSEIMRLAFQLKSYKQFDIIYRRYIHRDGWRRICKDLNVKKRTAMDLHDRAIMALEQILDAGA